MVCIFQHIALRWAFRQPYLKVPLSIYIYPYYKGIGVHVSAYCQYSKNIEECACVHIGDPVSTLTSLQHLLH